jgi:hypothetical protein
VRFHPFAVRHRRTAKSVIPVVVHEKVSLALVGNGGPDVRLAAASPSRVSVVHKSWTGGDAPWLRVLVVGWDRLCAVADDGYGWPCTPRCATANGGVSSGYISALHLFWCLDASVAQLGDGVAWLPDARSQRRFMPVKFVTSLALASGTKGVGGGLGGTV